MARKSGDRATIRAVCATCFARYPRAHFRSACSPASANVSAEGKVPRAPPKTERSRELICWIWTICFKEEQRKLTKHSQGHPESVEVPDGFGWRFQAKDPTRSDGTWPIDRDRDIENCGSIPGQPTGHPNGGNDPAPEAGLVCCQSTLQKLPPYPCASKKSAPPIGWPGDPRNGAEKWRAREPISLKVYE